MTRDRTRNQPEADDEDAAGLSARAFAAVRARPRAAALSLVAVFAFVVITSNALFLQPGPHPAPLFGKSAQTASGPARPDPAQTGSVPVPGRPATSVPATPDNLVAAIQSALRARGLYDEPVDGAMGPATRAAISAYEEKAGLEVTGAPSVALLASLSSPAMPTPAKAALPSTATLKRLQQALVAKGYGPITVDGIYGSETAGAIRRYELDQGLSVTGTVSAALLSRLGVTAAQPEG